MIKNIAESGIICCGSLKLINFVAAIRTSFCHTLIETYWWDLSKKLILFWQKILSNSNPVIKKRLRLRVCNTARAMIQFFLLFIDLCDYYLGSHQLLLLNYYPYIARFLAPHQREVRSHIEKIEKQDFNAGIHQISGWQDNRP